MFVFVNGKVMPKDEANVSIFDHGFLYGVGLFETFRVYEGHSFLLDDHLERINKGLEEVLIDYKLAKNEVLRWLTSLLESNNYQNAYVRLNVSAGYGELGLQVEPYQKPNIIIYTKTLPPVGEMLEKKIKLLNLRRNSPEGGYRLKSHHFLNNILAKREIGDLPDVEGIFLNSQGYLAEGVVSNLFWVKDKVIYTPAIDTGILPGITRQFIIKLAQSNNFQVEEGFFYPEKLEQADEIFITNSIQEIVAVREWEGNKYPGKEGTVAGLLFSDYRKYCFKLYSRNELS